MKNNNQDFSRRNFIGSITTVGAAMMLQPAWLLANNQIDQRVSEIVARTIGVDTYNHKEETDIANGSMRHMNRLELKFFNN